MARLEDALRHLPDRGVSLGQHEHRGQGSAVDAVGCLEGDPAEEADVRPAARPRPFAGDQVIKARGGGGEEAVKVLVPVVLVAHVPEHDVLALRGQCGRIRLLKEAVLDREE
ncbi:MULTISPECIES: hypothetical protein [unclassified Streptomyces]|uniref:hypothetical protein n=1 Tax=unclassified Streptomyces TaxID=2593676 RepID=UPI001656538E|nr:hypothetical protein [Streptomyces sp. CB02980]MCB8902038.1 hypothetical protein [Streptomyces sp. CB02980]